MTIKLRNQCGTLVGPLPTFDAVDSARLGDMISAEIGLALEGLLLADDFPKVKAIVEKYTTNGVVNDAGAVVQWDDGDAIDPGRAVAAKVALNIQHNQSVARGYRDFWKQRDAEYAASIKR